MKGVVFTEFIEMVEEVFGLDHVDSMITESNLPSGGIYTAVGTYDHNELLTMVKHLSMRTNSTFASLVQEYGM